MYGAWPSRVPSGDHITRSPTIWKLPYCSTTWHEHPATPFQSLANTLYNIDTCLEEGDHVLRGPGEFLAELLLLGGDADGAVVRVADARHDAALRDHGDRSEPWNSIIPQNKKYITKEGGGRAGGRAIGRGDAWSADCICPGRVVVKDRRRELERLGALEC